LNSSAGNVKIELYNFWYEKGDTLWGSLEFILGFPSKKNLESEFEEGGLKVVHIYIPENSFRGGAILQCAISNPISKQ